MTLREWWWRVRGSLRRGDALEREMEREMEFHVEMSARRNVERGMTPEAARRQAQLAFGSAESFKEAAREAYRAREAPCHETMTESYGRGRHLARIGDAGW